LKRKKRVGMKEIIHPCRANRDVGTEIQRMRRSELPSPDLRKITSLPVLLLIAVNQEIIINLSSSDRARTDMRGMGMMIYLMMNWSVGD
jgi:hypothetical protein